MNCEIRFIIVAVKRLVTKTASGRRLHPVSSLLVSYSASGLQRTQFLVNHQLIPSQITNDTHYMRRLRLKVFDVCPCVFQYFSIKIFTFAVKQLRDISEISIAD
ncbi:hypothetical protein Plhal304r1_c005g0019941 [Plasmopara halstedii]